MTTAMVANKNTFRPPEGYKDCSPSEICNALEQMGAARNAVFAVELELIATMDATEAYIEDGVNSVTAWLQMRFGLLASTAREMVRVARALEDLPKTKEAIGCGQISYDVARFLTKFVDATDEDEWLAMAVGWSATQARQVACEHRAITEREAEMIQESRSLRFGWSEDKTTFHLVAKYGASDGSTIEQALMRTADQARAELPFESRPTWRQSCADALVEIASGRLGSDPDKDRASVNVHVGYKELLAGFGSAEIGQGFGSIDTARRLLCDSTLRIMVDGEGRSPIGVGRAYRTAPASLIRLVRYRDVSCRFPGCERTNWCKAHHIIYWEDGGTTDLENLVWLCHTHHIAVHEGGWRIEGTPSSGLRFISPKWRVEGRGPPLLRIDLAQRLSGIFGLQP